MNVPGAEVAITGLGLHGGFGDLAATWRALGEGGSAVQAGYRIPAAPDLPLGCAVPAAALDLAPYVPDRKLLKYMSQATAMAVLAAGRALADAGFLDDQASCAELALFMATSHIAFDMGQAVAALTAPGGDGGAELDPAGLRRCHPLLPFKLLLNMPLGLVSIVFGIRGPNFILYPGAEQGAVALEAAARGIASGRFARALVGGSAQMLGLAPLLRQRQTRLLAAGPASAYPYRSGHAGYAPADQAAFVVLESTASAAARSRRPYALLASVAVGAAHDDSLGGPGATPSAAWLTTGNHDEAQDLRDQRARAALPGTPAPSSFDGELGFGGAAALFTSTVLGCQGLALGAWPTADAGGALADSEARLLVSFRDRERSAAVSLRRIPA